MSHYIVPRTSREVETGMQVRAQERSRTSGVALPETEKQRQDMLVEHLEAHPEILEALARALEESRVIMVGEPLDKAREQAVLDAIPDPFEKTRGMTPSIEEGPNRELLVVWFGDLAAQEKERLQVVGARLGPTAVDELLEAEALAKSRLLDNLDPDQVVLAATMFAWNLEQAMRAAEAELSSPPINPGEAA